MVVGDVRCFRYPRVKNNNFSFVVVLDGVQNISSFGKTMTVPRILAYKHGTVCVMKIW